MGGSLAGMAGGPSGFCDAVAEGENVIVRCALSALLLVDSRKPVLIQDRIVAMAAAGIGGDSGGMRAASS